MNAFGIGDMQRHRRTDAASREDNTREGRMKNIEKTVMEILMRLENSLPKSIEGTFLDVTAVHYANMSNVKLRHDVTDGADDSASPGSAAVGSSKEQPQGAKDQAGRSGFFGDLDNLPGPKNSESAYVV